MSEVEFPNWGYDDLAENDRRLSSYSTEIATSKHCNWSVADLPPARDAAGWLLEAQDLYQKLLRECASADDEPCPLLAEFQSFVFELEAGRFRPAGHLGAPFDVRDEFDPLLGKGLVALWTLSRNLWVYHSWLSKHDSRVLDWYARRVQNVVDMFPPRDGC